MIAAFKTEIIDNNKTPWHVEGAVQYSYEQGGTHPGGTTERILQADIVYLEFTNGDRWHCYNSMSVMDTKFSCENQLMNAARAAIEAENDLVTPEKLEEQRGSVEEYLRVTQEEGRDDCPY